VNSSITLRDENGPGGAVFQRNPTLESAAGSRSVGAGTMQPRAERRSGHGLPAMRVGYIFNNGFGGKMPGVEFLGRTRRTAAGGLPVDPSYMPWGHTNPTYSARDDIGKAAREHTLQFGAQYVYSQAQSG